MKLIKGSKADKAGIRFSPNIDTLALPINKITQKEYLDLIKDMKITKTNQPLDSDTKSSGDL